MWVLCGFFFFVIGYIAVKKGKRVSLNMQENPSLWALNRK